MEGPRPVRPQAVIAQEAHPPASAFIAAPQVTPPKKRSSKLRGKKPPVKALLHQMNMCGQAEQRRIRRNMPQVLRREAVPWFSRHPSRERRQEKALFPMGCAGSPIIFPLQIIRCRALNKHLPMATAPQERSLLRRQGAKAPQIRCSERLCLPGSRHLEILPLLHTPARQKKHPGQ